MGWFRAYIDETESDADSNIVPKAKNLKTSSNLHVSEKVLWGKEKMSNCMPKRLLTKFQTTVA